MIAYSHRAAAPTVRLKSTYRPDIDGLRAIAILTVVAFHAGLPGAPGGFVGVDVFFVISGFLITSMLVDEAGATGTIDLLKFYGRRMRRLMPAFLLVLMATLLAGFWLDAAPGMREPQRLARSALAALTVRANHFFLNATDSYFAGQSESFPLLHTWSLSVEEQFYLVWPLGILLIRRFVPTAAFRAAAMTALSVVLVGTFARNVWLVAHDGEARAFYLLPTRAWELAMGGLLCQFRGAPGSVLAGSSLSLAGLAAIGIAVVGFGNTTAFPGWAALLPTAGTVLVILGNQIAPRGLPARLLSSAPFVGIGLVSYSLYLWHWPMLSFATILWGPGSVWRNSGIILVAIGLSILTYRYVESPFRRQVALGARPIAVVTAGLVSITSVAIAAGAFGFWTARHAVPSPLSLALEDHPGNREICFVGLNDARLPLDSCWLVRGSTRQLLVVWGDSHAEAWVPLAEAQVQSAPSGTGLLQLTKAGCPPLLGLVPRMFGRPFDPSCRTFNANVVAELANLRAAGFEPGVLLVARWAGYSGRPHTSVADPGINLFDDSASTPEQSLNKLREGLQATLEQLRAAGVRALVLLPAPEMRFYVPECLLRWGRSDTDCGISHALYLRQRQAVVGVIADVSRAFPNVRLLDPDAHFCTPFCHARKDGTVMFYDDDHVSASAARKMASLVSSDLEWLSGVPAPPAQ